MARLDAEDPVAPEGCFRIGSVTKAFTATLLFQLAADNVLRLDDTVEDLLPALVPAGERITLHHLVGQTSGLVNYTDDLTDAAAKLADRDREWTPRQIVAPALARPSLFPPGTRRSYSSTNYVLLGMVIEAATGRTYDEELERRILRPLGMRRTVTPRQATALPEPHAHGYLTLAGEPVDVSRFNGSHAWAAGGMASTAEDLNIFYRALLTGDVVPAASLRLMQTTAPAAGPAMTPGLGIAKVTLPSGAVLWGNGGGFFGYNAWSFHTEKAACQLTISATGLARPAASTLDVVSAAFS